MPHPDPRIRLLDRLIKESDPDGRRFERGIDTTGDVELDALLSIRHEIATRGRVAQSAAAPALNTGK